MPPGEEIVSVRLRNTAMLSNVDLQYSIVESDGTTGVPNATDFDSDGGDGVTCVGFSYKIAAGDYLIIVRDNDIGSGEIDTNNPYILDVATSPDPDLNEDNDTMAAATDVTTASPGYIAYKADEDWYTFTAGPTDVANITITASAESNVNLRYELFDDAMTPLGETTATPMPGAGEVIDDLRTLNGGTNYFIRVTDSAGVTSDQVMSYTVSVTLIPDPDLNEPNNTGGTDLTGGAGYSGGNVTYMPPFPPRLFAPGDTDLYYVDVNTNADSVIEVNWTGTAAAPLRVSILEEGGFGCGPTGSCVHTTQSCNLGNQFPFMDCESFACDGGTGECIGGGECGPGGNCTFVVVTRAEPITATAQPVNGMTRLFIRVAARDTGASDMNNDYSLSVTLRPDPDPGNELDAFHYPNFVESAMILLPDENEMLFDSVLNMSFGSPRNLNVGSAVTGALGFEGDIDIWTFPHPCPGSDCSLNAVYSTPAGSPDYKFFIYEGGSPVASWGANMDMASNPAVSGATFAGVGSGDCFYASNNDSGPYFLVVRDHNLNDWSTSTYSVTINVVANGGPCTAGMGGNACNLCCTSGCCDASNNPHPFTGACGED